MSTMPPPPPPPRDSPGAGWWRASDGNWYPPESHPHSVAIPPPVEPPRPSDDAAPPRRRTWRIALIGIVVVGLVVAVVAYEAASDDDGGDAASGAAEDPDVDSCTYDGLDTFGDIQLELRFADPLEATTSMRVTVAVTERDGPRLFTSHEFVELAMPGERFWLRHDTIEPMPPGVDEADITCEVVGFEAQRFGIPPRAPTEADSCSVLGVDELGDIQVELELVSPFPEPTDLSVLYALRDGADVRFASSAALVDAVSPGEALRISDDSLADLPPGLDEADAACQILGIDDFGTG